MIKRYCYIIAACVLICSPSVRSEDSAFTTCYKLSNKIPGELLYYGNVIEDFLHALALNNTNATINSMLYAATTALTASATGYNALHALGGIEGKIKFDHTIYRGYAAFLTLVEIEKTLQNTRLFSHASLLAQHYKKLPHIKATALQKAKNVRYKHCLITFVVLFILARLLGPYTKGRTPNEATAIYVLASHITHALLDGYVLSKPKELPGIENVFIEQAEKKARADASKQKINELKNNTDESHTDTFSTHDDTTFSDDEYDGDLDEETELSS